MLLFKDKVHPKLNHHLLTLIYKSQWDPMLFGTHHSSKYLLFRSTEERNAYNDMRVSNNWCEFLGELSLYVLCA